MDVRARRQEARRRARDARSGQEEARRVKEKRIEDLAVSVLLALSAVEEHERDAGRALQTMVEVEGLTLREAVAWCGGVIDLRTITRLRGLAESAGRSQVVPSGETD